MHDMMHQGKVPQRQRQVQGRLRVIARAAGGALTLAREKDSAGIERLALIEDGWKFWKWRGHSIHYIEEGSSGPPIVLVHGFGAHSYHWCEY